MDIPFLRAYSNKETLWKILSGVGIILLGVILLLTLLPNWSEVSRDRNKELGKVSNTNSEAQIKGGSQAKVVSNIAGPNFVESWTPASDNLTKQSTKQSTNISPPPPIVIDDKGTTLEFIKFADTTTRINNTSISKSLTPSSRPPLNTKDIYFSNSKNDPYLVPEITKTKENKVEINMNATPPTTKNISRVDKLFAVGESIKNKELEISILVKAEKINNSILTNEENPTEKPQIKLRAVNKKGVNKWFKMSQEVPLGEWQLIKGITMINPQTDFLHIRAQCGSNYKLSFIPQLKVSFPKKGNSNEKIKRSAIKK